MSGEIPSGTVTFLFTDVEGSTRLWEHHTAEMEAALERHDEIMREIIDASGGYVFSTAGDAFVAAFARADEAIEGAKALQAAISGEPWPAVTPIQVRMGLHTGETQERDGDYFGPALNRAARICSAGHGGQILVSPVTAGLVTDRSGLTELGSYRLKDLGDPIVVHQVVAQGLTSEFPPLRSVESVANNLPLSVDSFIGRDEEMAELGPLILEHRLVTLTGVGGTGKTRLGAEVAAQSVSKFDGGVWLIEFAPIASGESVPFAVADVLGILPGGEVSMVETLVASLRSRRTLLVLDNCEHVLDEVAELCEAVLRQCPGVHMLATSREGVGVSGERVYPLRSLPVENAAELFIDRAAASGASPVPTIEQASVIAKRLDGVPLAIELAAARVAALGVAEVEARLDERFRLLRGSRRSRVERHQTLWNTIAWSVDLLDELDRDVFVALSVFAGSFSLERCGRILGPVLGCDDVDVEDSVEGLVSKSLVVAETGRAGRRFRLLETVRQFGAQQLADSGRAGELYKHHAEVFALVAVEAWEALRGPDGIAASHRLAADFDNLRAACESAREIGRPEIGWKIVGSLGLWAMFRWHYELPEWVDLDTDRAVDDPHWQAAASYVATIQTYAQTSTADGAIARLDGVDLAPELQRALLSAEFFRSDPETVASLPTRTMPLSRSISDPWLRAVWTFWSYYGTLVAGDTVAARAVIDESLPDLGPTALIAARVLRGMVLGGLGDERGLADLEAVLADLDDLGWDQWSSSARLYRGTLRCKSGKLLEGLDDLANVVRRAFNSGDRAARDSCLAGLLRVAVDVGRHEHARPIWKGIHRTGSIPGPEVAHLDNELGPHGELGVEPPDIDAVNELIADLQDDVAHQAAPPAPTTAGG